MLDTKFWRKYFKAYDVLNLVIPYQELMDELVGASQVRSGDKVLDAGSGTGNLCVKLEELGALVTGFDYSEEGIRLHKVKNPEANIVQGDLTKKLPFSNDSFNVIVSNNALYTIDESFYDNIFKELYRVLCPGGTIVLSNVIIGFSSLAIYVDHIKKDIEKRGFFRAVMTILILLLPTIKIFYYNSIIKKENAMGTYHFFKRSEQKELLIKAGFKNATDDFGVYSSQGVLNIAYKI